MDSRIKKLIGSEEFTKLIGMSSDKVENIYSKMVEDQGEAFDPAAFRELIMSKVVAKYVEIDLEYKRVGEQRDVLRNAVLKLSGDKPSVIPVGEYAIKIIQTLRKKSFFDESKFMDENKLKYKAWKYLEDQKHKYTTVKETPYLKVQVDRVK
jgi:hypothetical protein